MHMCHVFYASVCCFVCFVLCVRVRVRVRVRVYVRGGAWAVSSCTARFPVCAYLRGHLDRFDFEPSALTLGSAMPTKIAALPDAGGFWRRQLAGEQTGRRGIAAPSLRLASLCRCSTWASWMRPRSLRAAASRRRAVQCRWTARTSSLRSAQPAMSI